MRDTFRAFPRANRYGRSTLARELVTLASFLAALPALAQPPAVGLSPVRAHRFGQPSLPFANQFGLDSFGGAFAVGDFDNDGASDLATGAPGSNGPTAAPVGACGAVFVRSGLLGQGLDEAAPPTVLGQFVAGSTNPAETNDWFGYALTACDLNGDGYDDLAVGVPSEDLVVSALEFQDAGVVEIYLGSAAGLTPPATTRLRERTGGLLDLPTSGTFFGLALACGDFNDDGYADLAIGMPLRDFESAPDAGRVRVFPGSPAGVGSGAFSLDQDTVGIEDAAGSGEHFGSALAVGDFDGDGVADLAIGVPGELIDQFPNPPVGAFHVVFGAEKGLGTSGGSFHYLTVNATEGLASFATVIATGDFDGDAHDDLAVGSPKVNFPSTSGRIYVYSGSPSGFSSPEMTFSQDTILGEGASSAGEEFGSALAVGDFDGDGADDLAVGTPFENVFGTDNGAIVVVRGTPGEGLVPSPTSSRQINHGLEGFPGDENEDLTRWGSTLATGDFDGNGHDDLAIGAPRESESLLPEVGSVVILYGALFADGFENGGAEYWSDVRPVT